MFNLSSHYYLVFPATGQVFGVSCDTLLDTDNSAVLAPDGLLRLLLNKFTYQELALSGSLSADILRTPLERFGEVLWLSVLVVLLSDHLFKAMFCKRIKQVNIIYSV